MRDLRIRALEADDPERIASALAAIGWPSRPRSYERYLREQSAGTREVFVAVLDDELAGYATLNWRPEHPPFAAADIPEIEDLNVLPALQRRGIGSALLDAAESRAAESVQRIGIRVGLDADYGAAQRLYVQRGYVPDGRGLSFEHRPVAYGEQVTVNDDLVLACTKRLGAAT